MDDRLEVLKDWVVSVLGPVDCDFRAASEDASFRRYFRVTVGAGSYIAMDAPPDKEDLGPYIAVAARFRALGLHVPEVFHQDLGRGFLLLSDLGDRMYLRYLNEQNVERLYGDALGALVVLQAGEFTGDPFLADYDYALLIREMELFREWYLIRHLGVTLSPKEHAVLDRAFELLARCALDQPRVWVHRDYHSRNLMVTERNNPGILDFQDAVRGPATYDLVSLLRDCYVAWPRARVEDWALGYQVLALQSGLPVCEDESLFLRWFDWMGAQRHLKAAGIFARLNHRDGKNGYLSDIPRTLGYVLDVSARYPELDALHQLLRGLGPPSAST
ncbi:MAG: phosphotransferase [Gammaproteobacteria bacterium]|nr:phosphotransferase [Gammaproteobacteria bacterium]